MRLLAPITMFLLAFVPSAWAKGAKAKATGGHPAYARTLIFDADRPKGQAAVVLPKDALSGVAIKAPLLTLEAKKDAPTGEEHAEVESVRLKESTVQIAPAK